MEQNEILARLRKIIAENQQFTTWTVSTPHLVALVNEAIAAEREACAKVADTISDKYGYGHYGNEVDTADEIAAAIRSRSEATLRGQQ